MKKCETNSHNARIPNRTITNMLSVQFIVSQYQRVAGKEITVIFAKSYSIVDITVFPLVIENCVKNRMQ